MTGVAFGLNHALDSGRYDDVSVYEVKRQVWDGTVFDFFERRLGRDVDVSLLHNDDRAELVREWQGYADAIDEEGKYGAVRNRLCLLIAYLLEGIQQRKE